MGLSIVQRERPYINTRVPRRFSVRYRAGAEVPCDGCRPDGTLITGRTSFTVAVVAAKGGWIMGILGTPAGSAGYMNIPGNQHEWKNQTTGSRFVVVAKDRHSLFTTATALDCLRQVQETFGI